MKLIDFEIIGYLVVNAVCILALLGLSWLIVHLIIKAAIKWGK